MISPVSTAPITFYKVQYIILVTECQEDFTIMSPIMSRAEQNKSIWSEKFLL
jgi:hypothetical protein